MKTTDLNSLRVTKALTSAVKPSFMALPLAVAMIACLGVMTPKAHAVNFSFHGTFQFDNDVPVINFTVAVPGEITIVTRGYGGGTLSDGTVIAPGGFDPLIHVWNADGTNLAFNDDSLFIPVNDDPSTGQGYDSGLEFPVAAGDYFLTIAQVGNQPAGTVRAAGYTRDSNPDFTRDLFAPPGSDGYFYDVLGNHRTGDWAIDLLNVNEAQYLSPINDNDNDNDNGDDDDPVVIITPDPGTPVTSPVPEPLTATLAFASLFGLGMAVGRRR